MHKLDKTNQSSAYKFLVPFLIAFLLVNLFPYLTSFYVSFQYWSLYTPFIGENIEFVKAENYLLIYDERGFFASLLNVLLFLVFSVFIIHSLALLFAKLISISAKKTQGIILIAFIVPFVVNTNATNVGLIEMGLFIFYDPINDGVILKSISESISISYQFVGFFTLIYYMVLKSVPKNIIEAAQLDGASIARVFLSIELPHLKRMIVMMLVLSMIMMMQSARGFVDIINVFFRVGDMGLASAFSWTFIFLVLVFIMTVLLILKYRLLKSRLVKYKRVNKKEVL
ncbi:MAG: sugar ABC transporter permease [Saccharospirillaceae bacterium]|nr:sugar ABC transporter permease [Pseudomonadales bacterium]NRB78936.1 sugar ABC transporter permease [Saccharospirillaceae bacterium]